MKTVLKKLKVMLLVIGLTCIIQSCGQKDKEFEDETKKQSIIVKEKPE